MPASVLSEGGFLGSGYVFYQRLKSDGKKYAPTLLNVYKAVTEKINTIIKDDNRKKIHLETADQLEMMAHSELNKEQQLIYKKFGIKPSYNLNEPQSVSSFIQQLLDVIGLKEHHLRNITRLLNKQGEKKNAQISISKFGLSIGRDKKTGELYKKGYFLQAAKTYFKSNEFETSLKKAIITGDQAYFKAILEKAYNATIRDTLERMLNSETFNGNNNPDQFDAAYQNVLRNFENDPTYRDAFEGQLKDLFKVDQAIEHFSKSVTTPKDIKDAIDNVLKGDFYTDQDINNIQGSIEELLIEAIVKAFSKMGNVDTDSIKLGHFDQKTDNYITVGKNVNSEFVYNLLSHKKVSRQTAMEDAERITEKLKEFSGEFLIHINAKNYTLGKGFEDRGGFDAGAFSGSKGLNFLRELYAKVGKSEQAEQVFNGIKNIGKKTVGAKNPELRVLLEEMLGSDIMYALFDDFKALGNDSLPGGQQIHILDLGGIQVPLSFYLMLLSRAYRELEQDINSRTFDIEDLVKVKIKSAPAIYANVHFSTYANNPGWWDEQKEYSDANSIVSAHFMKKISQIVEKYMDF